MHFNLSLISIFLSGWAASASVFINLLLVYILPQVEYASWIQLTSLLPFLLILLAPIMILSSRVGSVHLTASRQAVYLLVVIIIGSGFLILVLAIIGFLSEHTLFLSGVCLWLSVACKAALDGIMWTPNIVNHGLIDKFARIFIPTTVLIGLIIFQPQMVTHTAILISVVSCIGALFILRSLKCRLNLVAINMKQFIFLYLNEFPSLCLSFFSIGVFSIPLYIFSIRNDSITVASLGVILTIVQGASAFSTILLSQQQLKFAQVIESLNSVALLRVRTYIFISFLCCVAAVALISGYGIYHSLLNWMSLAISGFFLVLIETSQSQITNLRIRLGDKLLLMSAATSAIFNISFSFVLSDVVTLVLSMAIVQLLTFLIPGFLRLHELAKIRGSSFEISI